MLNCKRIKRNNRPWGRPREKKQSVSKRHKGLKRPEGRDKNVNPPCNKMVDCHNYNINESKILKISVLLWPPLKDRTSEGRRQLCFWQKRQPNSAAGHSCLKQGLYNGANKARRAWSRHSLECWQVLLETWSARNKVVTNCIIKWRSTFCVLIYLFTGI